MITNDITSTPTARGYVLPDLADMVTNISAVLDVASADEWAAGTAWYRVARRASGVIGRQAGFTGERAYRVGAGIIAALSPSTAWALNVDIARAVVANHGRSPLDASRFQSAVNVAKAVRIMDGAEPLDVLGGSKVRAFYRSIIDPTDLEPVCIDRHAVAIALGSTLDAATTSSAVSGYRFERIADAYRAVAAARGLTPSAVQAITWVTWRHLKGLTD